MQALSPPRTRSVSADVASASAVEQAAERVPKLVDDPRVERQQILGAAPHEIGACWQLHATSVATVATERRLLGRGRGFGAFDLPAPFPRGC